MSNYDPTNVLAEILAPRNSRARPLDELGYHQGVITAFNASTGENTVVIAGALINDVPMLNIGDTTSLIVGDTVAVIRYRNAYFIIGRVVVPNTSGFASSSFAYETVSQRTDNFVIPTATPTVVATATATIPEWSNYGILNARFDANGFNQTGARDTLYASIDINGTVIGPEMLTDLDDQRVNYTGTSYARELNFLSPGTWNINGRLRVSNNAFAASQFNVAYVSASVMYLRR